ncbi:outer membrane porin GjpA [Mycobacterium sp. pUA109]|uniref:outer membrane porin GjpA n=1 Tax=Mycobacterium sp. pUA109 TaxID=3238982 RepID=UPI00351B23CC
MQQLATRPWITAGVALAGASLIAVTPVTAPPRPDVALPDIEFTAGLDPITPWVDVIQQASTNVSDLVTAWSSDPFPIIRQIATNQIGYLEDIFRGDFGAAFSQIAHNLQAGFTAPFVPDANLLSTVEATWSSTLPGLAGQLAIRSGQAAAALLLGGPVNHLNVFDFAYGATADDALLHALLGFTASPLSGVLIGAVGPVLSPVLALGDSIQAIVGDLSGPETDPLAALNELINIPAHLTGAFLNGGESLDLTPLLSLVELPPAVEALVDINNVDLQLGGLLSPAGSLFNALGFDVSVLGGTVGIDLPGYGVGPIGSLIALTQAIADAITPSSADMFSVLGGDLGGLAGEIPNLLAGLLAF